MIWQGIRLGVQAGSAAWTAYQAYKIGQALASDQAMMRQLAKGEYWDAAKQAFIHFPYATHIKDGYLALDKGDYHECLRQAQDPVTGIIIAYAGGKAIEKGGEMVVKIAPKALKQLRKFQEGKGQGFSKTQGNKAGGTSASSSAIKVEKVIAKEIKNLPTVRTKLGIHCIEICTERGITKAMAEKTLEKGLRYYDPKNHSIVYVIGKGMGSGDHLMLAVVPENGLFKTVFTRAKPIHKRLILLD